MEIINVALSTSRCHNRILQYQWLIIILDWWTL